MNIWLILYVTIILELATVMLLFRHSVKAPHVQKRLRFPMRIHHLYLGVVVIFASGFTQTAFPLLELGFAVALSDLVHHFVVLPLTGHTTEFPGSIK